MSRKHCIIRENYENHWIIQNYSTFGIFINSMKITKGTWHELNHEDIIQLDALGVFVYKFIIPQNLMITPRKRIKLENFACTEIIKSVEKKFEESQHFEICNLEEKLQETKQLQSNKIILKEKLESDLTRKIHEVKNGFATQIKNLKGEQNEVDRQKMILEQERDSRLVAIKNDMEKKIAELMVRTVDLLI